MDGRVKHDHDHLLSEAIRVDPGGSTHGCVGCSLDVLSVVGGFAGDGDVVDVGFAEAGACDAAEAGVVLEVLDVGAAGVAHAGAEAADELVDDGADGAFVADAAFDAFGDELEGVLDFLLEVAVGTAPGHGADAAHAAV